MKKLLFILIPALILTTIFIIAAQFVMNYNAQKGALQVTSAPDSKVYLDGQLIGQTPLCKCEPQEMLKTGTYTIRLVPKGSGLAEFQEKITISPAVLTVVDRKFAKDSLSEGSVISLSPLPDKKATELLVVSLPQGAAIYLDESQIGETPYSFKNPTVSDHVLTLKKSGYKDKTIRIRTPLGYKLTVAAYLSTLTNLNQADQDSVASQAATVSITPTPSGPTVVILDTPTGFLRVRDTINGNEIARVTPGESYPLISEQAGWLQIKLTDGKIGWVTSQYAQKKTN